MRIISGENRGKLLNTPEGLDTRPTSDRARQAIFNMLEHSPFSDGLLNKNILDVFAGTGAFGLEALSRGAASACFIENNKSAIYALKENIKSLRRENQTKIISIDAKKLIAKPNGSDCFDIVFCDPPYYKGLNEIIIAILLENNWLSEDAIIILEHHKSEIMPEFAKLTQVKTVNYGVNGFSIYKLN